MTVSEQDVERAVAKVLGKDDGYQVITNFMLQPQDTIHTVHIQTQRGHYQLAVNLVNDHSGEMELVIRAKG